MNIFSYFTCNWSKLETAQKSKKPQWIDTVVHLYNIIIFNNKKEQTPDTCNNIGESQKYIRKTSQTGKAECYIIYWLLIYDLYRLCNLLSRRENYVKTEIRIWFPEIEW